MSFFEEEQEQISISLGEGSRTSDMQGQLDEVKKESDLLTVFYEEQKEQISRLKEKNNQLRGNILTQADKIRDLREENDLLDDQIGELKKRLRMARKNAKEAPQRQKARSEVDTTAFWPELWAKSQRRMKRQYEAKLAAYRAMLGIILLYGLLCTILEAMRQEVFVSDISALFEEIWILYCFCVQKVHAVALSASQWAGNIQNNIVSMGIQWIIYGIVIVFVIVVVVAVFLLICYGLYRICVKKKAYKNSLITFLISLAIVVYFAEPLKNLGMNLIILMFLINVVCALIRLLIDVRKRMNEREKEKNYHIII